MGKNKPNNGGRNRGGNSQPRNNRNSHLDEKTSVSFNEEELKRIITEAIRDALQENQKRLEENEKEKEALENKKLPHKEVARFFFRFFFFPFLLYKDKLLKKNAHDQLLIMVTAFLMDFAGLFLWIGGPFIMICGIIQKELITIAIGLLIWTFGSLFVVASKSFDQEKDSMKIYAYSACVLALASFIASLVSLYLTLRG